jgi:hypothetical protein
MPIIIDIPVCAGLCVYMLSLTITTWRSTDFVVMCAVFVVM